ncbi:putative membrane protein YoaS [Sporomusaceae bacterium FL31]|nr:putative membrane protein YoaS [Sporomusaceae bacterium FL31]GCE33053.1 putative membrane protein YoaS [Sporomusaceae bacterium]
MKQVTTVLLKLAVAFIGIPVLVLCIFLIPKMAVVVADFLEVDFIKYIIYAIAYGAAIPFYFALVQAFKLLSYIDKNKAFSDLSVDALKKIKYCAITICIFHVFGLPIFYLIAKKVDPPGLLFIGMVVPFASWVIAVFAAVLQRLLQEAINIKTENDLTV